MTSSVPWRRRLALCVILGALCAWTTYGAFKVGPHRDFAQVWAAARAILQGQNPYDVVGPGKAFYWKWPLMYPLPAALVSVPLAPLSEIVATVIFSALAAASFAWALMEHGVRPLAGFFSAALMAAVCAGQWSPLLAGAVAVPWLGVLFAAKPTMGAVYFAYRPSWWAIGGGLALVAVSFALEPTWLADWRAAIVQNAALWAPATSYRPLMVEPGGALAALALMRWRRPEARMIAMLAFVPISPLPYEMVALFLVPRTAGEAALMAAVSWAVQFRIDAVMPELTTDAAAYNYDAKLLALVMIPLATTMVLRRPNEGALPAWLESRLGRWPTWLRGHPFLGPQSAGYRDRDNH